MNLGTSEPQNLRPPATMTPHIRDYGIAFLVATVVALLGDAALQLVLDAVRVSSSGSSPWWITANLVERGRWLMFAAVLWWAAPRLIGRELPAVLERDTVSDDNRREAWRHVGLAVLVVPLLWVLATWMVSAVRFTLLGSWVTGGQVFLSAGYYHGIVIDYAPWLMAGAALLGARKHV